MELQLHGKRALVTGSSKGIGEAIARFLAVEGAIVLVHGRDREMTEHVVASIVGHGGQAHPVTGDLTDDRAVKRLITAAEDIVGSVDILVNNAGGSGPKESWETTQPSTWASAYDRNVLAALRVIARVLPKMRQARWGRIVNISSLAGTMPPASGPDYSACKAAMNAMTVSLAKAVAAEGIMANAISPGTIFSPTLEARFRQFAEERGLGGPDTPWKEIEHAVLPMFAPVPLGRVGQLDDIANAVAFLASPLAGYITGVNLRIDGGASPSL
ncbi:SDR family NAD(P)-dependent oxidoreductase [Tunturibacter empetritectus]|uniref:SDR family NAD(P)-dependent oxidoreductase n=1 Tax=Tunturiibacter empetritectus TaxID=3069691 RepID=A0AAU7ZGC3_9BACT